MALRQAKLAQYKKRVSQFWWWCRSSENKQECGEEEKKIREAKTHTNATDGGGSCGEAMLVVDKKGLSHLWSCSYFSEKNCFLPLLVFLFFSIVSYHRNVSVSFLWAILIHKLIEEDSWNLMAKDEDVETGNDHVKNVLCTHTILQRRDWEG